jgi:hypothetical protein
MVANQVNIERLPGLITKQLEAKQNDIQIVEKGPPRAKTGHSSKRSLARNPLRMDEASIGIKGLDPFGNSNSATQSGTDL